MTFRSPWMWLLIAIVVVPISTYVIFWISLFALAEFSEGWHPAWIGDSSNAEIIVLVPDHSVDGFSAELIPVSSAGDYATSHPGSTFFIPTEIARQNQIQQRLKTDQKLSWTTFEIKKLSDNQEEITLDFMDRTDDSHGSRYRASKTVCNWKVTVMREIATAWASCWWRCLLRWGSTSCSLDTSRFVLSFSGARMYVLKTQLSDVRRMFTTLENPATIHAASVYLSCGEFGLTIKP